VDGRLVPRREALAQAVAERAVEVVVSALDMNALLEQVDLNAVLEQVDIERVLDRIDMDRLLDRVDLNGIVGRLDIDALVEQTDLGAVIARSSSGVASEALDGTDASGHRAVVRTLALPLSFLLFGLGFVGIILGDRRCPAGSCPCRGVPPGLSPLSLSRPGCLPALPRAPGR
jgi:hypothetical protein